ncbi:MAG: hypothetical protein AVDCRST_MAG96-772 [uncultured Segetibacter sp.]|uniref:Uncharacterized protein n=1 Tax=uncultured Segetibacter sp. TaxID=481133 RepID=A0A6J4RWA0_9BACT|nr:MAG: hypothetical protein AVDCRST_MAG96-772 [uncultured Segetibacter sp.]
MYWYSTTKRIRGLNSLISIFLNEEKTIPKEFCSCYKGYLFIHLEQNPSFFA